MSYDAFTVDTSIIRQYGYRFDSGMLAQLNQFNGGLIDFILSDIVKSETLTHVKNRAKQDRDALVSALREGENLLSDTVIASTISAMGDPIGDAANRVHKFIGATGAVIIPPTLCDMERLIRSYFDNLPPFENTEKKKAEFPDAIALLSMERWARDSDKRVLAVSKDKGWKGFSLASEHIDVVEDLSEALQIVQDHASAAAKRVRDFLSRVEDGNLPDDEKYIRNLLEEKLGDWEFEVEAISAYRNEPEFRELKLEDYSFRKRGGSYDIAVIQMTNDQVVVRVNILITAMASASFSIYAWDGIDGEEIPIGGSEEEHEEVFVAEVLMTIIGLSEIDNDAIQVEEIELVSAIDNVDFGEIEPDYRGQYDDDGDQLEMVLTGEIEADPDLDDHIDGVLNLEPFKSP